VQRLTTHLPAYMPTAEALQRLFIELIREHLHAQRLDDAVQLLHLVDITPAMTELPLHELFTALLVLSGMDLPTSVRGATVTVRWCCL